MRDPKRLAERLTDNWLHIGEFFASRNWPDTALGRAACDLNADLPAIVEALLAARPEERAPDPGTEKILRTLLDRAYKMMLMSVGPVAEHNPDHNDPFIAWMSDTRHVLYGSGRLPDPVRDLQGPRDMNSGERNG